MVTRSRGGQAHSWRPASPQADGSLQGNEEARDRPELPRPGWTTPWTLPSILPWPMTSPFSLLSPGGPAQSFPTKPIRRAMLKDGGTCRKPSKSRFRYQPRAPPASKEGGNAVLSVVCLKLPPLPLLGRCSLSGCGGWKAQDTCFPASSAARTQN